MALGAPAAFADVAFTTSGGDAWSFQKHIEATVPAGRCDEVVVQGPAGTVTARPDRERVTVRVPLVAGSNRLQAECRRDGLRQGAAAVQDWRVRLADAPKAWIRAKSDANVVTLTANASEPAAAQPAPIIRYEWRAHTGNPAVIAGLPAQGEQLQLVLPPADGQYLLTLRVTDGRGRADESTLMLRMRDGKAEVPDPMHAHPAWIDRAVVYGVVPALFGAGGLADVAARLDALAALGVTTLWLSPVTAAPSGDFGYAVTDHFRLRARLGTEGEFRKLVAAAHARGLRVIMDFVPNHAAEQNAYFVDAEAHRRASPYFDFFERKADGEAIHYFEWRNLKNLNFDNPEVRRLMMEAFAYWVREFDIDGFRVDVAWGPRERAPDFWPQWRAELKRIKPDLLLLAEASTRDPYYRRNGFDAAYDWTEKLGEWAWKEAFEDDARLGARLRAAIEASQSDPLARVLRFINNNDTGARFVTRHGVARTRVATAMLMTLPGIPSLFTGDEVGAEFEPYQGPPPLRWNDREGLHDWHARLIRLRRGEAALRGNGIEFLDAPEQVLAYLRADGERPVVVLLNYGDAAERLTLPDAAMKALGSEAVDLMSGERVPLESGGLTLPAHGVRILQQRRLQPDGSGPGQR